MKLLNFIFLLFIGILGCQAQTTKAPHPIIATLDYAYKYEQAALITFLSD